MLRLLPGHVLLGPAAAAVTTMLLLRKAWVEMTVAPSAAVTSNLFISLDP